jgi:diguanylate cyclase (GGDEF)-like protein
MITATEPVTAIAAVDCVDRVEHVVLLIEEAEALYQNGDHRRGTPLAEEAFSSTTDADGSLRVRVICALVKNLFGFSEFERCLQLSQEAFAIAQLLDDTGSELAAMICLTKSFHRVGMFRDAFELGLQSVDLARQLRDRSNEAAALGSLSLHYLDNQDVQQARQLLDQSFTAASEANDSRQMFWALNDTSHLIGILAEERLALGDRSGALALADEMELVVTRALQVARAAGSSAHETWANCNMASVSLIRGDVDTAETQIRQYRAAAVKLDIERLAVYANLDEARLLVARNRHSDAIALLESDEHEMLLSHGHNLAVPSHDACYRAAKAIGDFVRALTHLERRVLLEREHAIQLAERQARIMLARLDVERAEAAAERAKLKAEMQELRAVGLQRERDQLHQTAREDSLTGLRNRRAADEVLTDLLRGAAATESSIAVAFLDLDLFKAVNDTYGHAAGDAVLVRLAQLLEQSVDTGDSVFRFGGEEFLLVLTGGSSDSGAEKCEAVRQAIESFDWTCIGPDVRLTASFGIVRADTNEALPDVLSRADAALYRAKRAGRNRVVVA